MANLLNILVSLVIRLPVYSVESKFKPHVDPTVVTVFCFSLLINGQRIHVNLVLVCNKVGQFTAINYTR